MKYVIAHSGKEALAHLLQAGGGGAILAGGTDLMVDYRAGKLQPELLVDVTRASDLRSITEQDGQLIIGAAVTLTEIARSPLVRQSYPSLAQAAGTVGSLQIRNSATLVGNVVSAQPAADAAMALAPLDPRFTGLSAQGSRELTMEEMYQGFAKTSVDHSRELVTRVTVPLPRANEKASFIRLELRKSLSLPMLNCAAFVRFEGDNVSLARITMGPVGVGPVRAAAAEAYLAGKTLTDEVCVQAGQLALENANPRSNPLRGSREYRLETLPVLVQRALAACRDQR